MRKRTENDKMERELGNGKKMRNGKENEEMDKE